MAEEVQPNESAMPVPTSDKKKEDIECLFKTLGLSYDQQKLSLRDTREIREDTLKALHPENDSQKCGNNPALYPFILLQHIMSLDNRWATRSYYRSADSKADDNDSDDDDDEDNKKINPMDCLLALLHCSDNFLRQDILSRLATCQLAVPLLLPHPFTQEPTLLLWALRSIVKEFESSNDPPFSGRIIACPTTLVSFLRIGRHSISKSEILTHVINGKENKRDVFLHRNSAGGNIPRHFNGVVEVNWYLPSNSPNDLFPNACAFVNLRGDASHLCLEKQINFLCGVCTMHVVLLEESALDNDALKEPITNLFKKLLQSKGEIITLQKEPKKKISEYVNISDVESPPSTIQLKDTMNTVDISEKVRKKIKEKMKGRQPIVVPLADTARNCSITIDEDDDDDCKKGKMLAEETFSAVDEYKDKHPKECPKKLLSLQSQELWHKWAAAEKEEFRQKKNPSLTAQEYSIKKRNEMKAIRSKQYQHVVKLVSSTDVALQILHIILVN